MNVAPAERSLPPPYDRDACVRQTVADFDPDISYGIIVRNATGVYVQERYLADESYGIPGRGTVYRHLSSVDDWMAGIRENWPDPAATLTSEAIGETLERYDSVQRQFGPYVVDRATTHELTRRVSAAQASETLPNVSIGDLSTRPELADYGYQFRQGWAVFVDANRVPTLLVPVQAETEEAQFNAVNLDELYERDPGFVRDALRTHYRYYAYHEMVYRAGANTALHEANTPNLVPAFLQELGAITDPAERTKEYEQGMRLLEWVAGIPSTFGTYANLVGLFQRQLGEVSRTEQDMPLNLELALNHLTDCPGESEAVRQRSQVQLQAYYALKAHSFREITQHDKQSLEGQLLADPAEYAVQVPYRDAIGEQTAALADRDHTFAVMARAIEAAAGPEDALAALEAGMPETYATVMHLKEVLGVDTLWSLLRDRAPKLRFDCLLSEAAAPLWGESRLTAKNLSLLELNKRIAARLGGALQQADAEFDGVKMVQLWPTTFHDNPHLHFALPLLVIKTAEQKAQAQASAAPEGSTERRFYEERLAYCQELMGNFKQEQERRAAEHDKQQEADAQDRLAFHSFRIRYDITDADLAALDELVGAPTEHSVRGERQMARPVLYTMLFNVLYLAKQGVIDLSSDYLRTLFVHMATSERDDDGRVAIADRVWRGLAAAQS